jgi:hypothetical protein
MAVRARRKIDGIDNADVEMDRRMVRLGIPARRITARKSCKQLGTKQVATVWGGEKAEQSLTSLPDHLTNAATGSLARTSAVSGFH